MSVHLREDPFSGLAESIKTSNVVDLRSCEIWSWSVRTTSGATQVLALHLSNGTGDSFTAPLTASFVTRNSFTLSAQTFLAGDPGARFARFVREASGCSIVVDVSKMQWQ